MLFRQTTSIEIWPMMLRVDMTLASILSTILFMIHLIARHLDELNLVPIQEFVGLGPKCYTFLCTGKVDKNVLQHTRPVEKKTAKGVKRKVKDDHLHFAHYLDVLHSFKSYVCNQNLISSTNHTVHTGKVGSTAFDTKRWLCEDTVHTRTVIRIQCQIQWLFLASLVSNTLPQLEPSSLQPSTVLHHRHLLETTCYNHLPPLGVCMITISLFPYIEMGLEG